MVGPNCKIDCICSCALFFLLCCSFSLLGSQDHAGFMLARCSCACPQRRPRNDADRKMTLQEVSWGTKIKSPQWLASFFSFCSLFIFFFSALAWLAARGVWRGAVYWSHSNTSFDATGLQISKPYGGRERRKNDRKKEKHDREKNMRRNR